MPASGARRLRRPPAAFLRDNAAPALLLSLVSAIGVSACADHPEEQGRQLYMQHGCAVCHGAEGRGNGPTASRLDVPPRDFGDPRAYREGSSAADITSSIRNGAGAMPAFRDLGDTEAGDIAALIVSLQGRTPTAGGR